MAAKYVKAIRSIQPEGPYLLGGWSFGGHVAFEMAQQLRAQGQPVGLLVVIDTGTQEFLESRFANADSAKLLAIVACESAPEYGGRVEELAEELRKLGGPTEQVEEVVRIMKAQDKLTLLPDYADRYLLRALHLFETRIATMKDYTARTYIGPITLLQAAERVVPQDADDDPSWGW